MTMIVTDPKRIDLRKLKAYALDSLHLGSPLRDLLLAQRDELDACDFVAKVDDWLKLLRLEFQTSTPGSSTPAGNYLRS